MKKRVNIRVYDGIILVICLVQLMLLAIVTHKFEVKDTSLTGGTVSEYNEGWELYLNGEYQGECVFPYNVESNAGDVVVYKNTLPQEYRGKTLFFLCADKTVKVTIDEMEVYSFGMEDKRMFGHTPGSIVAFVNVPKVFTRGNIEIECVSHYDGYASYMRKIEVADRDVAILRLMQERGAGAFCSILIIFCGIILLILTLIMLLTRQDNAGMGYLGGYFLIQGSYSLIETKVLPVFFGNQTLFSVLVFITIMIGPLFLLMYYARNIKEFEKYFRALMVISFVNVALQLFLQITDTFDFMEMVFVSHILVFLNIMAGAIGYYTSYKKYRQRSMTFEFFGLLIMGLGGIIDMMRNYVYKIGDFAKYSRIGILVYAIILLLIHVERISKQYAKIDEERNALLQREVENMEQRNKLLEEANEAKDYFLASMSHEIRTPINGVLGMDEMILNECGDEKIREYALDIQSAGRNLLAIINDILDFSKVESGKLEIVEMEYNLVGLVEDSYNMISLKSAEKNLALNVNCDSEVPAYLIGDEMRIRQILNNLLSNAVKYTDNGSITIHISFEKKEKEAGILVLTVEDTGIGISKESQTLIFNSFQRVDSIHNRKIEGTGLGLAITKRLTDMMKGEIIVQSELQKGSSFTVRLPQSFVKQEFIDAIYINGGKTKKEITETIEYAAKGMKVLAVDDSSMNLKVMTGLLTAVDCVVDTALSGEEGLKLSSKIKYDIIFLDHMMPEMDGIEVFKRLRGSEDNLNRSTPIIMVSANAIVGAREKYLEIGFDDYIAKPVNQMQLIKVIQKFYQAEIVTENEADENQGISQKLYFLDVENGLSYCADDEELYIDILNSYLEENRYDELQNLYVNKDWKNYQIVAHALKSTSLSIGANELSENAKKLEFAVKEDNISVIEDNHDRVMAMYQEMLMNIRSALLGDKYDDEKKSLLVIDEDKINQRLMAELLGEEYAIDTAISIEEGLNLIENNCYDVIAANRDDMNFDYEEFKNKLEAKNSNSTIIYMTSDSDYAGENRTLVKPYVLTELKDILE